jgi:mucin-19
MTKARDISKLLSTANGKIAGANLDVSFENITDTGTEGTRVATGTSAQRGSTAGQFRFNSQTGLAEYYDGTAFKSLDTAPTVASISPTDLESSNLPANITITGDNFQTGATVKFIGNDGTEYASPTVTRNSSTSLTAQVPNTITSANEPYSIKVTNSTSNLAGTLGDALNIDASPVLSVASGSLGTLEDTDRTGSNLTSITATDDEGDAITFSVTSGTIPTGLTLNSNGTWSGTANAETSNTTYSFTVTASDGTNTSSRAYTITINAPTYVQLSGSGTWSVPAGVNSATILVVGGGSSGTRSPNVGAGGGGAGGVVYASTYTFTSTDKSSGIAYSVGAGGDGLGISPYAYDGGYNSGVDTTFAISGGTITAKGGGSGGGYGGNAPHYSGFTANYFPATAGGSGGGGAWSQLNGGSSNQGTFSGWTSYGNSGGTFSNTGDDLNGAGGGGAGASGGNANASTGGTGGAGQYFSGFSTYGDSGYFGGGGAGGGAQNSAMSGGQGGGGNGGFSGNRNGQNATDTTGGGGGGASHDGYGVYTYKAGDGGNGTILIKY